MKNIAIIGCNRGIGLSLAKIYNENDYSVYGFCRSSSQELNDLGLKMVIEDFDVLNPSSLKTIIDQHITETFDEVLHVSGVLTSETLQNLNADQILEQFKVNSLGPLLCINAFLPKIKNGAKIGLITSRMGSIEDNTSGGMYGYRMSKCALNMAGRSLAHDLQPQDVSVVLLHPGYVKTDMTNNNGHIDSTESAQGLFSVFNSKSMKDTGTFWHMNGEQLPW